jgi:hypothetical protein
MRNKNRKKMTERARELLCKKLDTIAPDDETKIQVLEKAIES